MSGRDFMKRRRYKSAIRINVQCAQWIHQGISEETMAIRKGG
jgi:hypothetical protein